MSHMPNTSCFTVFWPPGEDTRPRLASRSIAEMPPCFPNLPRAERIFVVFGAKKTSGSRSVCVHDARFCFAMCVTSASMPGDISDALLAAAVCSSVEGFGFLLNVEPESYAQSLCPQP